jgi:2,5-dioxopentanoate dehydrogenase
MAATTFEAHDPSSGESLGRYSDAGDEAIASACSRAADARQSLRDAALRVRLLRIAATRLREAGDALHVICHKETGLPRARLEGELERTCVQLELFASVVEEGSYVEAIIDTADLGAPVAPRPDLRRMLVPIGPVAVFGASNFPYAFSVAGGDTASALAAGCPVVVKAHPSHPGTSELVAAGLRAAAEELSLPHGVFSMLHGSSSRVGQRLVESEELEAVAFTGSLGGGRALFDAAAARPRPIPVFAEMGSVNPIVVTPAALREREDEIADGLTMSVTNGTGQFCTKPGVVLVPDGDEGSAFVSDVARRLESVASAPMLNARIRDALRASLSDLERDPDVTRVTVGAPGERSDAQAGVPGERSDTQAGYHQEPVAYEVDAPTAARRAELLEERFGPAVLFVRYTDLDAVAGVLAAVGGQLTGTVHAQPEELPDLAGIVTALERTAGRVIFDGFPTGVAATHAMQHGGPYPATTAPEHTSVGTTAIRRFLRPVVWQNAPASVLPEALHDANPLRIWRVVNGQRTRDAVPAAPAR